MTRHDSPTGDPVPERSLEQEVQFSVAAIVHDHPDVDAAEVESMLRRQLAATDDATVHHYRVVLAERNVRWELRRRRYEVDGRQRRDRRDSAPR